ncbi:flavastacin [Pedobacter sp. KBW06]|uniref:M12 family metallopeptidase n=1 Tax=Pedobacter sp. KBW06 TaxID=2153359 RepID=UPI000F5B6DAF|nr:M12 family metallopeptidase [Pedobacter sp. KBW06]RQO74496.1 flavastacin [Pedobacter sp. KBW06]
MKLFFNSLLGICLTMGIFFSCKKNIQNNEEQNISSIHDGDTIIHTLNINGNINIIKEINNEYFYADDIILSKKQFNSLKRMTLSNLGTIERSTIALDFIRTWPDAKVYYSYPDATKMTVAENKAFVAAINTTLKKISDSTNIKFILRTNQPEYMQFVKHPNSNNSPVGWEKGKVNMVNLFNFNMVGVVMHEVIHSLGIMHEQCRPDRDDYIIVHFSNIKDGHKHNFNKNPNYAGHGPFDFNSIMLYSSKDFAKGDSLPSMTRLDGTIFIKQRKDLSAGDINGLKTLYFPAVSNGTYGIRPVYLSDKSISVSSPLTGDETDIVLYENGTTNDQKFYFRKVDHGYYQIKSLLDTNKVLTVKGALTSSGTRVELSSNAGSASQKFRLYNIGNEGFSMAPMNALSLRLEVLGGSIDNLAPIVVSTYDTNSKAQKFNLIKL